VTSSREPFESSQNSRSAELLSAVDPVVILKTTLDLAKSLSFPTYGNITVSQELEGWLQAYRDRHRDGHQEPFPSRGFHLPNYLSTFEVSSAGHGPETRSP
jgi:hypothetical protein